MDSIPTVYANKETVKGVDLLTFDCPKCGKTHTHGYGEGHRVSHCQAPDAWERGYYLKEKINEL